MKFTSLRAATAIALVLSATAAYAQTQKEQAPGTTPRESGSQGQQQERAPGMTGQEPNGKAPSQGAEKSEPKDKATKGTAQKDTEPKEKATKGTAQKDAEPKEKATKGTAQKNTEPKEKATKGAAQKTDEPAGKATKGSAEKRDTTTPAKEKSASDKASPSDSATKAGTQPRAQLSEQQQTRVRETVLKQRGGRVTNVNFSITIGTRVPRSVQLAVLPAAVIEVVPEYRSYRYVVVRDDIVIIDPGTYEIVYVLPGRSTTAGGGGSALTLSDEQIAFVLRNIDLKSDSRLGIGGISVGATLGREVQLREFPAVVIEKLPELRSYRYLVHENDVAFVDSRDVKVVLVKENRR
jgi:hypothetical protein